MRKLTAGPEKRYATALFDICTEKNIQAETLCAAEVLTTSYTPELRRALSDPAISMTHKKKILTEIASIKEAPKPLVSTMLLMAEKGRTSEIEPMLNTLIAMIEDATNIMRVYVRSPQSLSVESQKQVEAFARKKIPGSCEIILEEIVDESLIGGVHIYVDGKAYDATIKGSLNRLHQALNS